MDKFKSLSPTDTFWYGTSISMVVVSIGITFSLIRGSELNLEALDTKLTLSGIVSRNKELTQDLKQVSKDIKKVPLSPRILSEIKEIDKELENAEQEIIEIEEKFIEKVQPNDDDERQQSEENDQRQENQSN